MIYNIMTPTLCVKSYRIKTLITQNMMNNYLQNAKFSNSLFCMEHIYTI